MDLICQTDARRDAVRSSQGRNGLDYVEVETGDGQQTLLYAYFLGKLPRELSKKKPGLEQYLSLEGGDRITGLKIVGVEPQVNPDPERDDYLVIRLDRAGDFSPYTLRLAGVAGIDPRYQSAQFSFRLCCPSDLDCAPACDCEPQALEEPQISYLAKDYSSFRQLLLDRMALLMPDWTERHVPDLGVTLVELLAYAGDYLSYYQDAVATEAYLGTARQRISVRRHARLVDYHLHEGCNARAWVCIGTSQDLQLNGSGLAFVTGLNAVPPLQRNILHPEQVLALPQASYEWFEPVLADVSLQLRQAHSEIQFYTWGERECCLPQGATSATLLDHWLPPPVPTAADTAARAESAAAKPKRALGLKAGDVLIFEEVLGTRTGVAADADPVRRWAVRLTQVQAGEDSLYPQSLGQGDGVLSLPTPLLEIQWAAEDALPFALCLSAIGAAPDCAYIPNISVARGNVLLVDHGRRLDPEPLGAVPAATGQACCECEGHPSEVQAQAGRYRPVLGQTPLTFCQPPPPLTLPASQSLNQDPRQAVAALSLDDGRGGVWTVQPDLLSSTAEQHAFVAELDNDGVAHLRFGDGELGRQPDAGSSFTAGYRIGHGSVGNVGAESISRLVSKQTLDGVTLTVRNPLPAQGGSDAEPIEQARLFAPAAFRKVLERAIIADDYAQIAGRNPKLQRAAAALAWTGSWYEADVAVDPWNQETADPALLDAIADDLHQYRRMGHDLRVQPACYVPLKLTLQVCALPGYERGHVKAALLQRFSNRRAADGSLGFFQPDALSFGGGIYLSQIVAAAQAVQGVECVTVSAFHRSFEPPNHELENGVLPLAPFEIAQLDNDPDHPEHGQLQITVRGGR